MSCHRTLSAISAFDHRDPSHRTMRRPLADVLVVATEAAHAANDAPTAERLDQAWLLVVAAVVDRQEAI